VTEWTWRSYAKVLLQSLGGGIPGALVAIFQNPVSGLLATLGGVFCAFGFVVWDQQKQFRALYADRKELVFSFHEFVRDLETYPILKELSVTYEVGLSARRDRRRRDYLIAAGEKEIMFVKELRFGAVGDKVPSYSTLEQLGVRVSTDVGRVYVVPTFEQNSTQIIAHVRFTPPIKPGEERRLTVLLRWPGEWNDLRANRRATGCGYDVNLPIENLRIVISMPPGIRESDFELERASKFEETGTIESDYDPRTGRWSKIWHIPAPEKDNYEYSVVCGRLGRVRGRATVAMRGWWWKTTRWIRGKRLRVA